MKDPTSFAAVKNSWVFKDRRFPLYDSYCFARIPDSLAQLLTGESIGNPLPEGALSHSRNKPKKVVLFLLDGLGLNQIERYFSDEPLFLHLQNEGTLALLTSQFPSTTAAHIPLLYSGVPMAESGIFEWCYLEPKLNRLIQPLPYRFHIEHGRDKKLSQISSPDKIFPKNRLVSHLTQHGVRTFSAMPRSFLTSPFNSHIMQEGKLLPYLNWRAGVVDLATTVAQDNNRGLYLYYYDAIDSNAHVYGQGSSAHMRAVREFCAELYKLLLTNAFGARDDTLILLTADHGHTSVDPEKTIYINRTRHQFEKLLRCGADGRALVPAGSPRDMFLYVKEGLQEETVGALREFLPQSAFVLQTKELIDAGFFGKNPSKKLKDHVGDIAILPGPHDTVWWYEKNLFDMHFYSHHGGLSTEEMEIPLFSMWV